MHSFVGLIAKIFRQPRHDVNRQRLVQRINSIYRKLNSLTDE